MTNHPRIGEVCFADLGEFCNAFLAPDGTWNHWFVLVSEGIYDTTRWSHDPKKVPKGAVGCQLSIINCEGVVLDDKEVWLLPRGSKIKNRQVVGCPCDVCNHRRMSGPPKGKRPGIVC